MRPDAYESLERAIDDGQGLVMDLEDLEELFTGGDQDDIAMAMADISHGVDILISLAEKRKGKKR